MVITYDLALVKTIAPGQPTALGVGDQTTYNITVTNQGIVPSNAYSVIDQIPTGMSFVSASDGGSHNAGIVRWVDLPSIQPGTSKVVSITLRMDDTSLGSYRNYAEIYNDSAGDFGTSDEDSTPDADLTNDQAIDHDDGTADNVANDEDDHDFEDVTSINIVITCIDVVIDADQVILCQDAGAVAQLVATSSAGATYAWTPSTGLNSTTSATPIATPNVTTTYTVNVVELNGCESSAQVTITVLEKPTPSISPAQSICAGGSTQLSVSGGESYVWSPATGLSSTTSANPTCLLYTSPSPRDRG